MLGPVGDGLKWVDFKDTPQHGKTGLNSSRLTSCGELRSFPTITCGVTDQELSWGIAYRKFTPAPVITVPRA